MQEGFSNALKTFKSAAKQIPAYGKFLRAHKVDASRINSLQDFSRVPIMEKNNYLYKFPSKELFSAGKFPPMIYASSGSSGKPTFWYRGDEQEEWGARLHGNIFTDVLGINKKESTLVVICFSMGVWVAGNYTLAVCRKLSSDGFDLTAVTPGIEREDIFSILKNIAPDFDNVILAGYPPFLMDIVCEAKEKGINFKSAKYFGLTAGDKFSESWRNDFLKRIGQNNPNAICSIYGCADAGILGYETKLSIFLRRKALKNKQLYKELFGDEDVEQALVQYSPEDIYFEKVGAELVFTINSAIPLIRYNIHDIGDVYSQENVAALLKKYNLDKEAKKLGLLNNMPMLVKKGRTDVAVTFYALNIYPEHIRAGVEDHRVSKHLSGNFAGYHKFTDNNRREELHFEFELVEGQKPNPALVKKVTASIIENLLKKNIEYRKLRQVIGTKSDPVVHLVAQQDISKKIGKKVRQAMVNLKGKKPKMVLAK